jgi:hypothetical protein
VQLTFYGRRFLKCLLLTGMKNRGWAFLFLLTFHCFCCVCFAVLFISIFFSLYDIATQSVVYGCCFLFNIICTHNYNPKLSAQLLLLPFTKFVSKFTCRTQIKFLVISFLGVKQTDYGDITSRKQLRDNLQCKSFRWYLEHIYPESQMPLDYYSLGEVCLSNIAIKILSLFLVFFQIRNKETNQCLDTMGRKAGEKVGIVGCHGMGGNQVRLGFLSIVATLSFVSALSSYHSLVSM